MPRIFVVTVYKNLGARGAGKEWANQYHLEHADEVLVTDAAVRADAEALAGFERSFHSEAVYFNRATVSTMEKDEAGLTEVQNTIDLNYSGLRDITADDTLFPKEALILANLSGNGGRRGRKEYRGCVTVQDVNGLAETFGLNPQRATFFDQAFATMFTGGGGVGGRLRLVSTRNGVTYARPVSKFTLGGVKFQKTTATRRPKISQDSSAIIRRLRELNKDLAYINASLSSAKALGIPLDAATLNALIQALQAVSAEMDAV